MAAARSDLPLTSDHEAVCALQRRLLGSGNARGAEAFATTVTASGDGVRFPAPNATPLPAVASMAPRGHSALEPDAGAAPAHGASRRARTPWPSFTARVGGGARGSDAVVDPGHVR